MNLNKPDSVECIHKSDGAEAVFAPELQSDAPRVGDLSPQLQHLLFPQCQASAVVGFIGWHTLHTQMSNNYFLENLIAKEPEDIFGCSTLLFLEDSYYIFFCLLWKL